MKRMYLALGLVIICIFLGVTEIYSINYSSDKCLENFKKIESAVDSGDFEKAVEISQKNSDEYESFTGNVVFCYYPHTELEKININLSVMTEAIRNKDVNRYKEIQQKIKKQLNAIKEEELFNIQNLI